MASLVAVADATYSASTNEVTTVLCFFDDQNMHPPAISNANPLTEHQSSGSCPQLESVHPTRLKSPFCRLPRTNLKSTVPLR